MRLSSSALLAIVLLTGAAMADSEQIVTLHDGSKFRGTLVELVKDDHVTIKLATGEVRKFPWADVDKTEEVTILPPETAEEKKIITGAYVTVDTQGRPAKLQQRTGSVEVASTREAAIRIDACDIPCNRVVPVGTYRLAGAGVRRTAPFELPDHGRVRVDATLGSSRGAALGYILLSVGGGLLVVSASFGAGAGILVAGSGNGVDFSSEALSYGIVAGVAGGIGLVLLIPGLIALASNSSHTTVTQLARLTTTGLRF